jgi:hypothetical protein
MRLLLNGYILTFLFCNYSCSTTKNLKGTYVSKFAIIGFFATRVTIKSDTTFGYHFSGDLENDSAQGEYKILNNILFLKFDTLKLKIDSADPFHTLVVNHSEASRPYQLLFKHNKLFKISKDGQITKMETASVTRRKFILFGQKISKFRKKKYYYKKLT